MLSMLMHDPRVRMELMKADSYWMVILAVVVGMSETECLVFERLKEVNDSMNAGRPTSQPTN